MDLVFCQEGERSPGDPVPFSGDAGLAGSFRLFFADGRFTVGRDKARHPSPTSRATCPPR
ncbi:MAG: hypothetical protein M3141_02765 [Actinomycetota bacterium]|nr:hypothetical protein [Actinomycetota bacterium]